MLSITTRRLPSLTAVFAMALAISPTLASAQTAPNGEILYKQRCAACHAIAPGAKSVLAPSLRGVVGRNAAATPAFNYSPALKGSKLVWTRPNLEKFIAAPTKLVPGTRMVMAVPDAKQRGAILNYIASQR